MDPVERHHREIAASLPTRVEMHTRQTQRLPLRIAPSSYQVYYPYSSGVILLHLCMANAHVTAVRDQVAVCDDTIYGVLELAGCPHFKLIGPDLIEVSNESANVAHFWALKILEPSLYIFCDRRSGDGSSVLCEKSSHRYFEESRC